MSARILGITALGVLLSSVALAQPIHQPQPTKKHPGDAPADGITGPRTITATPAAGDVSIKFPEGSTVITPEYTGTPRDPEVINPVTKEEAAPVDEVSSSDHNAQAQEAQKDGEEEDDFEPPAITIEQNGIRFVSGGVGERGLAYMKSIQPDFKLKLVFAASSGHYLSGVTVTLTNKEGEPVLTMTTEGPTLLVDLPEGTYTVTAHYQNAEATKKVTAGKKGVRGYTVVFTQPVT